MGFMVEPSTFFQWSCKLLGSMNQEFPYQKGRENDDKAWKLGELMGKILLTFITYL